MRFSFKCEGSWRPRLVFRVHERKCYVGLRVALCSWLYPGFALQLAEFNAEAKQLRIESERLRTELAAAEWSYTRWLELTARVAKLEKENVGRTAV